MNQRLFLRCELPWLFSDVWGIEWQEAGLEEEIRFISDYDGSLNWSDEMDLFVRGC